MNERIIDALSADQLVVFATVAEERSVTGAARRLMVSQPAVSGRLRSLQTLAGRQLYRRTPTGIALTDAGETLLPHAQAVRRALMRGRQAVSAPGVGELRTSVALSEAAIHRVAPTVVAEALRPPQLDVRIVPCDASTAVRTVLAGDVDMAVTVALPDPPTDDLVRRPIASDEIVLVQPTGIAPLRLADLRDHVVLWQARGSGVRATTERVLEVAGVWPDHVVDLGSSPGVLAAVADGLGVGFLPRSFAAADAAAGRVRLTGLGLPDLEARFELIAATIDELPYASQRLAGALRHHAGDPGVAA